MLPNIFDLAAEPQLAYKASHSREKLDEFIADYNAMYNTGFSTRDSRQYENYYKDISKRIKEREKVGFNEKDRVDILMVVNMFLTGFDAKKVNTLYVDKNLRYHGLIQTFSRTNRILNEQKSHGNILCFRNLKNGTIHEKIRSNVYLVNNISVKYDDVILIFSTLWSKINLINQWTVQQNLSDFQVIKYNNELFTPVHYNQLHQECIQFIEKELKQNGQEKTIVVSHHAPTFLNYPEKYKGNVLNEAFAVELFDLIETNGPDYWIFGHHHQNISDFKIGKTKLSTNQLGYVRYNEHHFFKQNATIFI